MYILKLLNKTRISISNDDTRHYLNGIFLHITEANGKNFCAGQDLSERKTNIEKNNDEFDDDVNMEELLEEFEESLEEMDSEEIETNYEPGRVNKSNPVKDKQSIFSRIFQGKTERY